MYLETRILVYIRWIRLLEPRIRVLHLSCVFGNTNPCIENTNPGLSKMDLRFQPWLCIWKQEYVYRKHEPGSALTNSTFGT